MLACRGASVLKPVTLVDAGPASVMDGGAVDGGTGCSSDDECSGGFCDRTGKCEFEDRMHSFGTSCKWAPNDPVGDVNGKLYPECGAYRCFEQRCRSCASDAECGDGSAQCRSVAGIPGIGAGYSCGEYRGLPAARSPTFQPPPTDPLLFGVRVEHVYPHALDAFTEGLLYHDGWLYESTGLIGSSSLRRIELETGRIVSSVNLDADVFGEGLAQVDSNLFQLSYLNGRALVWNQEALTVQSEFRYEGEGWGLCYDGRRLIMSDGSTNLQLRDPKTFEQFGSLPVDLSRVAFPFLNELECVGGDVYANLDQHRQIVRIDGTTGTVTGWIDTGFLLLRAGVGDISAVGELNGIAYVPERDRFLLTGKNWPWVFEVAIVPFDESPAASP
jgi:glutaminyl-peptide cyclotransferase